MPIWAQRSSWTLSVARQEYLLYLRFSLLLHRLWRCNGGIDVAEISKPNVEGLKAGLPNLDKHIANLKAFGQTVVVCLNRFATDTDEELALVKEHCEAQGVGFAINTAFGEGGKGAEELAHLVVDTIEKRNHLHRWTSFTKRTTTLLQRLKKIAKKIYGAGKVVLRPAAKRDLQRIKELGFENFPVCIAKTQYLVFWRCEGLRSTNQLHHYHSRLRHQRRRRHDWQPLRVP